MALANFQELIDDLARDPSGAVSDAARDRALEHAVLKYSLDRPRSIKADAEGVGSPLVPMPAEYDPDFSAVLGVERVYSRPVALDNEDWSLYQGTAGWHLMFGQVMDAQDTVRVAFTAPHIVSIDQDTIPAADREAVCNWAAALILQQLATEYAGDRQSTIQADSVDHATKSRDYAARAVVSRNLYYEHLGIDPKRTAPAGTVIDWDTRDSRGQDRLTHPRVYR
jgi:hypothetical protein